MEAPAGPVELSDQDFDAFLRQHELVVVDFWAPWCPPCRMMAPIIDELAKRYAGKVVFAKLNVDESPLTAMRFEIRAVPTFLVFKRGRLVARWVGAMPKELFEARLRALLGGQ
ncbi:thioredoxin [Candidatus Bathyarchaeota archaeon]|nr:MAG: thioredoxin [Candidatus Bathyarchaeota archaeon]